MAKGLPVAPLSTLLLFILFGQLVPTLPAKTPVHIGGLFEAGRTESTIRAFLMAITDLNRGDVVVQASTGHGPLQPYPLSNYTLGPVLGDTRGDTYHGYSAADEIVSWRSPLGGHEVAAVVGPSKSGVSQAAHNAVKKAGALMISFGSTSTELSSSVYSNFYRVVWSDSAQAKAVAALVQSLNVPCVAMVSTSQSYSSNLAARIVRHLGQSFVYKFDPSGKEYDRVMGIKVEANVRFQQVAGSAGMTPSDRQNLRKQLLDVRDRGIQVIVAPVSEVDAKYMFEVAATLGMTRSKFKWIGADSWIASPQVVRQDTLGSIGTFPMEPRTQSDCGSISSSSICLDFIRRWESSARAEVYAQASAGLVAASFVNQSRNLAGRVRTTVSDEDVAVLLRDETMIRRTNMAYAPSTYDATLGVAAMLLTTGCIDASLPRRCLAARMPTHRCCFMGTTGMICWDPSGVDPSTGVGHVGDRIEGTSSLAGPGHAGLSGPSGTADKYLVLSRDIGTYVRDVLKGGANVVVSPVAEERGRVGCSDASDGEQSQPSSPSFSSSACASMAIKWGKTAISFFVAKKKGDGSNIDLYLKEKGGNCDSTGLPNSTAFCLFNTTRLACSGLKGQEPTMLAAAPWQDGYQKELPGDACWFDDFSVFPTHGCSDTVSQRRSNHCACKGCNPPPHTHAHTRLAHPTLHFAALFLALNVDDLIAFFLLHRFASPCLFSPSWTCRTM